MSISRPIHCSICGDMALALLREEPLCDSCLLNAVGNDEESSGLFQVRPLPGDSRYIGAREVPPFDDRPESVDRNCAKRETAQTR